jgi:hypothetical protein
VPDATIIHKAFKKIAANKQTTKSVYNQAVLSGLKCSIPNFWRVLVTILGELKNLMDATAVEERRLD